MEKRVFKRKIYNKILKWKNESNGETALMVQGARRIGRNPLFHALFEILSHVF